MSGTGCILIAIGAKTEQDAKEKKLLLVTGEAEKRCATMELVRSREKMSMEIRLDNTSLRGDWNGSPHDAHVSPAYVCCLHVH